MIVRFCAEFRSSLPDDRIENEEGTEFLQYPGRNVATAVSEILRRLGHDADPPENAGDHGWDFEVRVKGYPRGVRLWCTLTLIDYYLLVVDNTSWRDRVREHYPAPYLEVLRGLGRELAADARFSEVHWKLPKDVTSDRPGASQPVED